MQPAEASGSQASSQLSDSQLLKDNELDLLQSQSILQDNPNPNPNPESNQKAPKRARKDKGSAAKSSDSVVDISFSNSQDVASLLTNSQLDGKEEINEQLRESLPNTGPLRFGSENRFPLNFAHEHILVQK